MNKEILQIVNEFWGSFHSTLYDCGFGDYTPCRAEDYSELYENMSFINGAAQVARLMSPYMSPQWQICHLISIAAGTLKLKLKDPATPQAKIKALLEQYSREFTQLLEQKKKWEVSHPVTD